MAQSRGVELLESAERRAGGAGGAVQTNFPLGPKARLGVKEIGGGASLGVTIEHSLDGTTWAVVGTFAAKTVPWSFEEIALSFTPSAASRLRAVWTLPTGYATFQVDLKI